ncbi:O-glycosyl hydrolase family 30 [Herbihabitans rhizosphaerae]|uniref:O-glycosyl hydrolase family 30 n=1 Tax=Herbihabitans rhizosphaerae TaxID=1872711 RepID=A0A4Q7KRU4_9PSEU|nr:hypothetical protein [Herbihabitans rhizosphaerae]RZS39207.1 O-glycosyl hydrolase family 30 [Herbihabitans rhizosphaerae]
MTRPARTLLGLTVATLLATTLITAAAPTAAAAGPTVNHLTTTFEPGTAPAPVTITIDETCCDVSDFTIAHDLADVLPLTRRAKELNPALTVMASPWSAPGWMKDNDHMHQGWLEAQYYADNQTIRVNRGDQSYSYELPPKTTATFTWS